MVRASKQNLIGIVGNVLQLDATGGNFKKLSREFHEDGRVTHIWLSEPKPKAKPKAKPKEEPELDFFFEQNDITFGDPDENWQRKFEKLQMLTDSDVALHHGGIDYLIAGPILRGGKVPKGTTEKEVNKIKSQILEDKKQIADAPAIPFDSKVYRFAGFEDDDKNILERQLADGIVSDPAFLSTSIKPEFVLAWARQSPAPKDNRYYFEIDVPKGSKGARLQSRFEVDEDDIFQEIELTFCPQR